MLATPRLPSCRVCPAVRGGFVAALLGTLLLACTASTDDATLNVFVASSLSSVAQQWEVDFEAANPDIDVVVNAAGSPALRDQISQGAPADVFVAADEAMVEPLVADGLANPPVVIARNHLAIGVPAGNPAGIMGLDDFGRDELLIGLCAAEVPCGGLARAALAEAGIEPRVDTEESGVRSLAVKLAAGELDAGLVYASDVANDPAIDGIAVPSAVDQEASYPAVALVSGGSAAGRFVEFLHSAEAQDALAIAGFQTQ